MTPQDVIFIMLVVALVSANVTYWLGAGAVTGLGIAPLVRGVILGLGIDVLHSRSARRFKAQTIRLLPLPRSQGRSSRCGAHRTINGEPAHATASTTGAGMYLVLRHSRGSFWLFPAGSCSPQVQRVGQHCG